ncbi:hypothetical protein ACWEKM_29775 [Streptomyces sp. NPDC004752]
MTPDAADGWDVRLTVRDFRFPPDGTRERARVGRGLARLFVDGEPVARLRVPRHYLAAPLLAQGTHQVTARLYADDGTVWAVHGKPVESTADVTASGATATLAATAPPAPTSSSGTPHGGEWHGRVSGSGAVPARSRPGRGAHQLTGGIRFTYRQACVGLSGVCGGVVGGCAVPRAP